MVSWCLFCAHLSLFNISQLSLRDNQSYPHPRLICCTIDSSDMTTKFEQCYKLVQALPHLESLATFTGEVAASISIFLKFNVVQKDSGP